MNALAEGLYTRCVESPAFGTTSLKELGKALSSGRGRLPPSIPAGRQAAGRAQPAGGVARPGLGIRGAGLPGAHAAALAQLHAAAVRRLQHLAFTLELVCAQVLAAGVTLPAEGEGDLRQLADEAEAAAAAACELLSSD